LQSLKILDKAKELAQTNQKFNTLVQLISLEKKIETLHITRSSPEKTQLLAEQSMNVSRHIERVTRLSNLALLLYRWYVINGHTRNETEEKDVNLFFKNYLPADIKEVSGFYELLYLYQSFCWYAFIRQDFLLNYRYAVKWIDLYAAHPLMVNIETGHYLKGMHSLLNAHFALRNFRGFDHSLSEFEKFAQSPAAIKHDNFRVHTSIYINSARINGHLMKGTFSSGVKLVPEIENNLTDYSLYVDQHRIMLFNYKIALLYFGSRDFDKAIDYLHRIIHGPGELRIDLQCYARLVHLLSHYELASYDILDSLSKSVHRFFAKMKNLTVVEKAIFDFLQHSFDHPPKEIRARLEKFYDQIRHLENSRYETRSFAYLDIISWAESKVFNKSMESVINQKYMSSSRR
jgi:tetratricopeptide (TPR) repeat protein